MLKAFKYLIYFSELFPKKYWADLTEEDGESRPESPSKRLFGSFAESDETRGR